MSDLQQQLEALASELGTEYLCITCMGSFGDVYVKGHSSVNYGYAGELKTLDEAIEVMKEKVKGVAE